MKVPSHVKYTVLFEHTFQIDPEMQEKQLFEQRNIPNSFQCNDPQYGFFRFVH